MTEPVLVERRGAVAEIVLNRPDKHNAVTPAMFALLEQTCRQIDADPAVNCVILRGAGDQAFCAGTDINTLQEYASFWDWRNRIDYVTQIRNLRKHVIAAIKGWALGGGTELAVACDIRVASRDATFGSPEVTLGWIGAGGTSQFLPRLLGYGQAMKILLTGDRVPAEEAFRIGLVEELVDPGQELERAREIADQIAAHPAIATQTVKAGVRAAMAGNLELGLRIENELMALCFAAGEDKVGASRFGGRKRD